LKLANNANLTLALFVARIITDHADNTFATYNLALTAHFLY
jgi:hypothetical protein